MRKTISSVVLSLWLSGVVCALPNSFDGIVSTVDPGSGTLVIKTSQGARRVELQKSSEVILNGKSNNLGQLQTGEHVHIEGIVLDDGSTIAGKLVSFGKDDTYTLGPTVEPGPQSQTTETRPSVRITFADPVKSAQFWLDGEDYTKEAYISGNSLKWTPGANLTVGEHLLRVVARVGEGTTAEVKEQWRFRVLSEDAAWPSSDQALSPAPNSKANSSRPEIVVTFPEDIQFARLYLDGADVSLKSTIFGNRLSYSCVAELSTGKHQATVQARGNGGQDYATSWNFQVPRHSTEEALTPTQVLEYRPGRGAIVTKNRPNISCQFSRSVDRDSIRVVVDGHVLTQFFDRSGNKISWDPNYDLDSGQHVVRVTATDANGNEVRTSWTFVVAIPEPQK